MQNYERLIIEKLQGDTPAKKFESLIGMQKLLQQIAYPARGTQEEGWTIYDVTDMAQMLVEQDKDYEAV